MTNAEAIEVLRANQPDACYEQLREAVDAAIEALKAQDEVGDTISRWAAIDALEEPLKVPDTWKDEYTGRRMQWEKDVKALNSLPSAQKKGHWIDEETNYTCSECYRGCWVKSDYCPWCGAYMRFRWKNGKEGLHE